jgi:hypothetical protein
MITHATSEPPEQLISLPRAFISQKIRTESFYLELIDTTQL